MEHRTQKLKVQTIDKTSIPKITVTGIMAALITLMTAYICHIPVGLNGGYIHFGDALIYMAAVLLPTPYALAAAAIGGGLADLLTAPMWAPATIVIKMLIVLPFTNKTTKFITKRNVIASFVAYLISGLCYYAADYILFGTWTALIASMAQSAIQSIGSAILFIVIGIALDKVRFKQKFGFATLNNKER